MPRAIVHDRFEIISDLWNQLWRGESMFRSIFGNIKIIVSVFCEFHHPLERRIRNVRFLATQFVITHVAWIARAMYLIKRGYCYTCHDCGNYYSTRIEAEHCVSCSIEYDMQEALEAEAQSQADAEAQAEAEAEAENLADMELAEQMSMSAAAEVDAMAQEDHGDEGP